MRFLLLNSFLFLLSFESLSQLHWVNVDSNYGPLPRGVHVFRTDSPVDSKPNIAFYFTAELKNKDLHFTTDTTYLRRLTPLQFYRRNQNPLLVVNGTFFSQDNKNLNVVIKDGRVVSFSPPRTRKNTSDSTRPINVYSSAIGISKKGKADIAWLLTDSSWNYVKASQVVSPGIFYKTRRVNRFTYRSETTFTNPFSKWDMQTAIGGGPVLIQAGKIVITNNEEQKFAGKAINDKHPRTAMGYTKDGKLIVLVVQGRQKDVSEGMNLVQLAETLKAIGCVEALNLDGGGSSCMLINGKETIQPSDLTGQRPVPAVFIIKIRN